ncbi:MAG: alpha/beta fold hydrolase [Deltaproteobacteria bacterium]|nr:MAG: alpha/beta fold hydrolase [Deltaproteobacteria bacterium]
MSPPSAVPLEDPQALAAHRAEAEAAGVADHVRFFRVETGASELHVAVAGPDDGVAVLMLHGFPDLWCTWAPQIPALVEAGYRLILPDQRGYNRSSKPESLEGYTLDQLGGDALALLEAFGHTEAPVQLVGHDWGAAVSWWLAENHPERFQTVTILNCPPMKVLAKAARSDPKQIMKSWYILFFQVPWISEKVLGAGRGKRMVSALRKGSRAGAYSEPELECYRQAWAQPGAVRGMLSWYRASALSLKRAGPSRRIPLPLTLLWGERDIALRTSLIEPSIARCDQAEVHSFPEAGHWVHRDQPDEVAQAILASFQRSPPRVESDDAST